MACLAMVPLLGFIGQTGKTLWGEWSSLRQDQVSERASAIVGYVNITPNPSFAERPADWFHDEGDATMLWSGWRQGRNHWFKIGQGDIDPVRLSLPIGRDVLQAIDYPLFEQEGGQRWTKVPAEALVAGFEHGGVATAYPLKVLDKVEIVNADLFGDQPLMIVCTPVEYSVSVFEATLDGHRVRMGHSGYFFGHSPILYDRGSESLWAEQRGAMVALTGRRKGDSLKRIAQPRMVAWGDWKAEHRGGKLLIGADRSNPPPVD